MPFALLLVALLLGVFLSRSKKAALKTSTKPHVARRSNEAAVCLGKSLYDALPNSVLHPDGPTLDNSLSTYWAKQACEVVPTCVIRPQNVEQLSAAVKILAAELERRKRR